ncbi:MAG: ACP S-malonyltransferase [Planctomycetales bacterium]|nr:ACP S-malonyltransferase [Planctomycetales bacterium]
MPNTETTPAPVPFHFPSRMSDIALAFRGYNVTNLGRTPELLRQPRYAPIVEDFLRRGSQVCQEVTGKRVDLVARVRAERETSLATYHEAIALVVASSLAQVEILIREFNKNLSGVGLTYGFSLGEITALIAGGVLTLEDALAVPISLAEDSVALAHDVTLGVLFSRAGQLDFEAVDRLCQEINLAGNGVIGVSAYLAPNSLLIIGQGDTLDRFAARRREISEYRTFIRKNESRWPPLHTPIIWQRYITNRAQLQMQQMPCRFVAPQPAVLSLVTGNVSYNGTNTRELIGRWVDQPQRLWDAVDKTLSSGIKAVVHVGPAPNIIPATFSRLRVNVETQTAKNVRMRALRGIVKRPWLQALLPRRASLLRATEIAQVNLEDWLLQQVNVPTPAAR